MYNALLALQYINLIGLFIESWIVFKSWKDSLRAYLFFSCMAIFMNNLGYLLEMKALTEEAYITALKFSYAGRIWVGLSLFLFAAELCRIRVPEYVKNILTLLHVGIYAVILTFEKHSLYYYNTSFSPENGFPVFRHENGVVHDFFMLLQGGFIIFGLSALMVTYRKSKKKEARKRLLMVIIALLIESAFFAAQMFNTGRVYDFTMPGFMLGTIFMLISIFRYNLLGTRDIAREFMVDRLSESVIAVDNDGDIQYYNEPARALFPGIKTDPDPVVNLVRGAILHGNTITINDRIYTPEENDLLYKGESFGKLFVLIDSTEHYKRLNKEKRILRKELLTDPITGFYNRKGMEYYSQKLYLELLEEDKNILLCVADMNGLKYINDNFGHEHGDKALTGLAKIIRDSLEEGDMAFRTGGDEFLIMGGRDSLEGAEEAFSERIEKCIRLYNEKNELPYPVDMSYGPVACELTGEKGELDELIKLSDSRMYEMKKHRDAYRRD